MENPEEQGIEDKLEELLGLQDTTTSYFKVDVTKDPLLWLEEFREFLDETEGHLAEVACFDSENEFEIARNINNPNWGSAHGQFRKRHIEPGLMSSNLMREASRSKMTEMRYLTLRCDYAYKDVSRTLKEIRFFLQSVNRLRSQMNDISEFKEIQSDLKEALVVLNLVLDAGYNCLFYMTTSREPSDMSEAGRIENQVLTIAVFAETLREHKVRTRLRERAVELGLYCFDNQNRENDSGSVCRHTEDFRTVTWHGIEYNFSVNQADCIKVLMQNWENGNCAISGASILGNTEAQSQALSQVFKKHPAWNAMIVTRNKGMYQLSADPSNKS